MSNAKLGFCTASLLLAIQIGTAGVSAQAIGQEAPPPLVGCGAESVELNRLNERALLLSGIAVCAPGEPVEIMLGAETSTVPSDNSGRFVFEVTQAQLEEIEDGNLDLSVRLDAATVVDLNAITRPVLREVYGAEAAPTLTKELEAVLEEFLPLPIQPAPPPTAAQTVQAPTAPPAPEITNDVDEQELLDYAYATIIGLPDGAAEAEEVAEDIATAPSGGLSIGFGTEDDSGWLLWDRESHYVENEMSEAYQPGGDWFNQLNEHHETDKSEVLAEERRGRRSANAAPFVIDLIWNNGLDLDLHVFEPKSAASGRIKPRAPGHVWSKAPAAVSASADGSVRSYPFNREKKIAAERYLLDATTASGLSGPLQIFVDYADRTKRKNADPRTCGSGSFAAPKATLRVSSARGTKTYPVTIKPLACGTPVTLATAFTPVGRIGYR